MILTDQSSKQEAGGRKGCLVDHNSDTTDFVYVTDITIARGETFVPSHCFQSLWLILFTLSVFLSIDVSEPTWWNRGPDPYSNGQ